MFGSPPSSAAASATDRQVRRKHSQVGEDTVKEKIGAKHSAEWMESAVKELTKSNLYLERARCEEARDDNIVVRTAESHAFAQGMKYSVFQYDEAGKAAAQPTQGVGYWYWV